MGKILHILIAILCVSLIISGFLFLIKYQDYYLTNDQDIAQEKYIGKYKVTFEIPSHLKKTIKPEFPDLANYSSGLLKKMMPDVGEGEIELIALEKAYPKVRSETAFYGDMQERLDPVGIMIKSGVVNLKQITKSINDSSAIKMNSDGGYISYIPIIVREKATFILGEGDTLLLGSNNGAFIAVLGTLNVFDAHILGWDTAQDQPAYFTKDGDFRPYLIAWCGSQMNITESYLGYLGYDAAKSYGVTYSSCENDKYVTKGTTLDSGTGWILDSEFENLYFGFYSYETDGAVLINNRYRDNIVYGIDPHDGSRNLIIANNQISGTRKKHGIITSRDVHDSYIINNIVEKNRGAGLMLDRNSHNNLIAYNISRFNGHDGLAFYESPSNISYKNILYANGKSGMRVRNSWGIRSIEDVMNDNKGYAVELYAEELKSRKSNDSKDPYQLKADLNVTNAEIIGNEIGAFRAENIDGFTLNGPSIYELEGNLFSGDLKKINQDILFETDEIYIQKIAED
jgi:poly(beta-D-mannuronate) C5 epimerase